LLLAYFVFHKVGQAPPPPAESASIASVATQPEVKGEVPAPPVDITVATPVESRPAERVDYTPKVKRVQRILISRAPTSPAAGEALVTSTPEGAQFRIDGRDTVFATPAVVNTLQPGRYKVVVSKAGFISQTLEMEVQAGARSTLVARLSPKGLLLKVSSNPSGAAILLDGRNTSLTAPAELRVESAGTHTITLVQPGYLKAQSEVRAKDGENFAVAVNLVPAGDAANSKSTGGIRRLLPGGSDRHMADVQFKTNPKGARLKLNGWSAPKATPFELKLPPGGYEIVIQAEGYKTQSKMIVVEAGQKLVLQEAMQPATP
jgi:hypothetical protein